MGIQLSDDSGMFTIDSKSGAISIAKNDEFSMKLNSTFAIFATFEVCDFIFTILTGYKRRSLFCCVFRSLVFEMNAEMKRCC